MHTPYLPPLCEAESYEYKEELLAGSDLSDGGAGDFFEDGGEFNF